MTPTLKKACYILIFQSTYILNNLKDKMKSEKFATLG